MIASSLGLSFVLAFGAAFFCIDMNPLDCFGRNMTFLTALLLGGAIEGK
jgi:hypothetical protein